MFTKPWVMTPRQTQIAAAGDYIRPTMCVPFDKGHLVKEDNTPYISSFGKFGREYRANVGRGDERDELDGRYRRKFPMLRGAGTCRFTAASREW